jgi:hypothetical protein
VVDRSAFDRIIAGRRLRLVRTGSAPDANAMPIPKERRRADGRRGLHRLRRLRGGVPQRLGDAVHRRAKVSPPRAPAAGPARARRRAQGMVAQMDAEGFGNCTNHGECEAACPKVIRSLICSRSHAFVAENTLTPVNATICLPLLNALLRDRTGRTASHGHSPREAGDRFYTIIGFIPAKIAHHRARQTGRFY